MNVTVKRATIKGVWGELGGSPNGITGGTVKNSQVGTTAGWSLSFTMTRGNYGSGGGAYGSACGAGGSGGYDSQYVNVTSGSSITVTVGSGGVGKDDGKNLAESYNGTAGFVLIAYGGDI